MSDLAGAPITVGVDGSPQAEQAVRLAVRLAASRHRPLRLVHAFIWPLFNVPLGPPPGGPTGSGLANVADKILADAVELARAAAPGLEIAGQVISGPASSILIEESERAELVVVGDRGLGGFAALMLGSVAVEVSSHASCPVVVVRGEPDREAPVLVGVDASPPGQRALEFAFDEAARRGVGVTALHAYTHPVTTFPGDMLPPVYDPEQLKEEENLVLREALAGFAGRYPDVPVRPVLVREPAARALVEASHEASMLVVGSRGLGGFRGLVLGSVAHAVMHHSDCPVTVIR